MSRPSKTNKCQILHTSPISRIYFFNHNSAKTCFFLYICLCTRYSPQLYVSFLGNQ
ncbi:Ovule protein [Caenorhabditis elegans]|uniref:Ovule protein n=1 Tax=Caenorhabditis elegans TaxID=6239 RepID=N1NTN1_CAEEL|nr:Ovule protein [Caenorhabditis elegans]CCW46015.1 Ovule protein [Caenorhabditis elegans]|eukprot:NP_001294089.1 Uncharacterized protein CELE_R07H5.16 [Caenorhabditis elegans]